MRDGAGPPVGTSDARMVAVYGQLHSAGGGGAASSFIQAAVSTNSLAQQPARASETLTGGVVESPTYFASASPCMHRHESVGVRDPTDGPSYRRMRAWQARQRESETHTCSSSCL
eukprot:5620586-Prymnesium_polylepis.2